MGRVREVPLNPLTAEERRLVEQCLPLARSLARRAWRRSKDYTDLDEMVSVAFLGLVEAAKTFDPARGVRFATYGGQKVRWAILDYLRDGNSLLARAPRFREGLTVSPLVFQLPRVRDDEGEWRDFDPAATPEPQPWEDEVADEFTRGLTAEERLVIHRYYGLGWLLADVAKSIGQKESRVSQLRSQAVEFLRYKLAARAC